MDKKNIIWLASFPKSGNTWFRAFLTALTNGGEVDINKLETSGIFSEKEVFEHVCDADPDELTRREVQCMRRDVYRYQVEQSDKKIFVKVHDAYTCDEAGEPHIPYEVTQCAVYFVRDPLDVAVSFSNHISQPVERVITNYLNNPESFLASAPAGNQFPQPLSGWSGHVQSWMEVKEFPVHILKYEDMRNDTFRVFKDIVSKIGMEHTDAAIQ